MISNSNQKIVNAYSYVRLSSKKQKRGGGKARQRKRAELICKTNGWKLSNQTFEDLGVSAFRGKNRLQGDLATFITLAQESKLLPHSVLIIEAFDRFSREDIDQSENAVLDLLRNGVALHVAFVNKTFTKESVKELIDRITILVSLKQAFDFSSNLSQRVKDAIDRKGEKIKNGEVFKVNNAPKYFLWNDREKKYDHHSKNVPFIRDIVNLYLSGNTLYGITNELNRRKIKTFRRGFSWSATSVRCILKNRVLIGEFLGNPKFFPPIISKEEFDRVQLLLNNNKDFQGRTATLANVFRGITECSLCGHSMVVVSQSFDYRDKKKWKKTYRYLRCSSQYCECRWSVSLEEMEDEFFCHFLLKHPKQLVGKTSVEVKKLQSQLTDKETELNALTKEIEQKVKLKSITKVAELARELNYLDQRRATLKDEIDFLSAKLTDLKGSPEKFADLKKLLKHFDADWMKYNEAIMKVREALKDNAIRKELRVILPSLIGKIVVNTKEGSFEVFSHSGKSIYISLMGKI